MAQRDTPLQMYRTVAGASRDATSWGKPMENLRLRVSEGTLEGIRTALARGGLIGAAIQFAACCQRFGSATPLGQTCISTFWPFS